MTTTAGIHLEAVTRHFEMPAGTVRAVDRISVEVAAGTSVAVTGPSGCGKSTLLALIGGLTVPSSGRVTVVGHEVSKLDDRARARLRRRELGFVFQSDNLLPFLTAVENISLQLALSGGGGRGDDDRCLALLAELGLGDHAHKLPDQLSGGERQRVAVARALVHRPRVVLADEPTGSLNAQGSRTLIDLLLAAHRETRTTLVVVTHDSDIASRMDRTLVMCDGRLEQVTTNKSERDGDT